MVLEVQNLQKYIAEESKGYSPPLKQIKSGVSIDEIQCKQNLTLVIKQNVSPACVKPETRTKLIERGWAIDEPEFFKTMYVELLHSFQHTQTQLALGDTMLPVSLMFPSTSSFS